MKISLLRFIFAVGVALVFSACGSKMDESTQIDTFVENKVDEGEQIDTFIESKIISGGVLSLTEEEFSREVASRIVERRITFTITHLSDRDKTIKEIGEIMKEQNETYRIIKENRPGVMEVIANTGVGALEGVSVGSLVGSFFPGIGNVVGGVVGGVGTGVGTLAYSLKDYIGDVFAKDTNWLISKSPDESVLNVLFVKDQNN